MDSIGRILLLFSLLVAPAVLAQSVHAFNWGFGPDFVQTSFKECDTRPIHLIPLNASSTDLGVPPYYMFEYSPGALTIPVPIGDNPSHLSWRVKHPKGSRLLLTVVDSAGHSGGFSGDFFTVTAGDSSCQPPPPSNPPRVTQNVSTSINTCEPWGLTITGGIKPYNISLAAVASPVLTNVSMGPQDDVFTFINRAGPGTSLLAAVVDATGQWGFSSVAVKTTGSKDTTCLGLNSSSRTRAQIKGDLAAAAAAETANSVKAKQTAIALGIIFGLVLPLILAAAAAFWWWRRRKRIAAQARPFLDDMQERAVVARPSLNIATNVGAVRVDHQLQRNSSWVVDSAQPTDSPTSVDMTSADIQPSLSTGPVPFFTSSQLQSGLSRSPDTQLPVSATARNPFFHPDQHGVCTPNSTSPAATLSPAQRYRKQLEALNEAQAARARLGASPSGSVVSVERTHPPVQRSQSATSSLRSFPAQPLQRRAGSSLRLPSAIPERPSVEGEAQDIIIQHTDGGIVEELPPPYRPPTTPGSPPPSGGFEAR